MWKKAYEKIQYTFMIKKKQQRAIEIKFPQSDKKTPMKNLQLTLCLMVNDGLLSF